MEQATRNKLRNVVTQSRKLLEESVSQELQGKFGIHANPKKDEVVIEDVARLSNLTGEEKAYRKDLIDNYEHIKAFGPKAKEALTQLIREIAFTHLNRLCAYKMMEARDVYVKGQKFREAVSRVLNSNGVKFYLAEHPDDERLFNTGDQERAYRHFLNWLGGQLSEEIGVLFNPNDPANRLYPRQKTLDDVMALINDEELAEIWSQDETIGWVYQYFTPKELRASVRKDKQPPRNSYELAFRNQFFTPRYVVEFLTDNTLGRIWYEMRKGETRLKDQCRYMVRRPTEIFLKEGEQPPKDAAADRYALSQEELLKLPVHITHCPKKDPRELKILDPACGSGHFLLYCFDLLLTIYEEAYADPDLGPGFQKDYPKLDDLRRDVPRLILAHNLHGIDIDLRASQIAALALWLRCQRANQEMGLKKDRPKITRSNFVCAEPMPGKEQMLKEFVGQPEPKLLGQVVEVVFDKMKLAGEAGSLLKIEEDIREAVAAAKKQWVRETAKATDRKGQPLLFTQAAMDRCAEKPEQTSLFDLSDISGEQFFEQAESKVIEALRRYAEKAHNGQRLQRRLFTEDAVRGFAFVDLCQKRYDVLLMNPPFGEPTPLIKAAKHILPGNLPADMYCWFVSRARDLLSPRGKIGCITSSSFKTYTQYESFRVAFIATPSLAAFVDLGWDVLDDAYVEASCYVIATNEQGMHSTPFFDVRSRSDKDSALLAMALDIHQAAMRVPHDFRILTSCPIIHEWPKSVLVALSQYPTFGSLRKEIGIGAGPHTFFYRLRWEVPLDRIGLKKRWAPFANGGRFSPFRRDDSLLLEWEDSGKRIKEYLCHRYPYLKGNTGWKIQLEEYYGVAGLTYGKKTTNFSAQALPEGFIFSFEGIGVFPLSKDDRLMPLAYLNSSFASWFLNASCGLHKNPVYVHRLPVPSFASEDRTHLEQYAKRGWELQAFSGIDDETSSLFVIPDAIGFNPAPEARTEDILCQIDQVVWRYVDIPPVPRYAPSSDESDEDSDDGTDVVEEKQSVGQTVISYAVGCVVGRWDIQYATGQRTMPALPDPFTPLPVCPPGMLQALGTPVKETPKSYPLGINWGGIIPDDSDQADDMVVRVREVLELIWKDRTETIEKEACETLGVKELRDYFRKPGKGGFWDDHVKRYSKSRRKAPIYWLLQSSKKNYALWIYYHRLDKDILFKALLNYVEPKIRLEEGRLDSLRSQKQSTGDGSKGSKKIDKEIEKEEDFLSELRDFAERLGRAARLEFGDKEKLDSSVTYDPDLNDGVVLNIAPLHELVPWKEAKAYWDDLMKGKYEWSSMGKRLRAKGLIKCCGDRTTPYSGG